MYDARTRAYLARYLADAFLAGTWTERALSDRAGDGLNPRPRWLSAVSRGVLDAYHRPPEDRPRELASFVEHVLAEMPNRDRLRPDRDRPPAPQVRRWLIPATAMGRRRWPVPDLASTDALAQWLGVADGELAWLADVRGLERTVSDERLRHYRYGTVARPGGLARVLERPKPRLKAIQRRLLHELLDLIPVHDAAHGFVRGRSVRTHAAAHVGREVVVTLDLEDFFASVSAGRVYGIFRTAGYPEPVAHALAGLATNVVPATVWGVVRRPSDANRVAQHHRLGRRLATPHLAQGAPTSPALANLAAFRLDRRLAGLAGALDITYTRYADDLTFSGPGRTLRDPTVLRAAAATIVREEGFALNQRKFRRATRADRQQVCGIIVNERPNVARADYDELKAILHNAAVDRAGPQGSGFDQWRAHVAGRIAWLESLHPEHGERLRHELARQSPPA